MTRMMMLTEVGAETTLDIGTARWIRIPRRGHCPHTGLSRTMLSRLIRSNKIRTASLKRPGTIRGARLVWLPSVMAYIDKFASGGEVQQ